MLCKVRIERLRDSEADIKLWIPALRSGTENIGTRKEAAAAYHRAKREPHTPPPFDYYLLVSVPDACGGNLKVEQTQVCKTRKMIL